MICAPLRFELCMRRDRLKSKVDAPGLVNFVPAVSYHFCLNLPAAFTQPGTSTLTDLCRCCRVRTPSHCSENVTRMMQALLYPPPAPTSQDKTRSTKPQTTTYIFNFIHSSYSNPTKASIIDSITRGYFFPTCGSNNQQLVSKRLLYTILHAIF